MLQNRLKNVVALSWKLRKYIKLMLRGFKAGQFGQLRILNLPFSFCVWNFLNMQIYEKKNF